MTQRSRISRREAAATAAAVLLAAAIPDPAGGQPASEADTRVTVLEKTLGRTLTPDERKAVEASIKGTDEAWAAVRPTFTVPDGLEPAFVFRPARLQHGQE